MPGKGRKTRMISRRGFLRLMGYSGLSGMADLSAILSGRGHLQHPHAQESPALPDFEEIPAPRTGISWSHVAGLSPEMYIPETVGGGCGFIDYDNDGWMDIYLVNSGPCDFYQPPKPLRNALYRNNRDGTFTDVTLKAGVSGNAYGMGVAVGDYDGDGFPDLYVTQYPHSILYHNNGDGTFTDVTAKAGVAAPGWATSAVWFDYDNDGRLDLFVCQFIEYSKEKNIFCGNHVTGLRYYCKPNVYNPSPCWLFHNNGDGTFTDVSKKSGISQSLAKAWGVVATDINNDGWMDLFVANDTVPNFLFANRKGKFEDIGLLAGIGYSPFGVARSGMGVDSADYNEDGWLDLFVANVNHESFALYRNNKNETFSDESIPTGIEAATVLLSGWGLKFIDYDNDGSMDLLIADGHPDLMFEKWGPPGETYLQSMLLFRNTGKTFENVSSSSGPIFSTKLAARGLAIGDFDNDGSVDALVGVNNGAPILLRNNAGKKNHWLGVRLVGKKCNRDAVGARVTYRSGDFERHRTKVGGGSYLAAHDPRMVLGLGPRTKVDWIEVKWPQPSGIVQRIANPPVDRYITVTEGEDNWK